jgi:hypothetical protein
VDLSKLDRYGNRAQFVEAVRQRAYDYDFKCHGCSQAVVQCFLDIFEEDNAPLFMAASPFAAGMSMTGNNCGALIGGLMILGVVFGRRSMGEGMEGIIDGIRPARRLVKHFQSHFGTLKLPRSDTDRPGRPGEGRCLLCRWRSRKMCIRDGGGGRLRSGSPSR